ncbi:MAG: ATP synthase F0 subunit B [Terriglobia bacterium]
MGQISGSLGQLYLHSLSTVVFVIVLLLILNYLFFRPLAEVMKQRADATEGALARAREQAGAAQAKSREYEDAIRAGRVQIYAARQEDRQRALAERESSLKGARERSEALVKEAQAALAREASAAKEQLAASAHALAREIAEKVLGDGGGVRA